MTDGMLSQDEIDALLNVSIDEEDEENSSKHNSQLLSDIEVDTLGEIGNISIGSSATTLSTLLNQKVEITTPEVSIITHEELNEDYTFDQVNIQVNYMEGFSGQNIFVMKSSDAAIISDIMLGGDGTSPEEELNEIHLSAVQEAMNQMMGAAATSMSTVFEKRVDISPPSIELKKSDEDIETDELTVEQSIVKVSFQLKIGTLIDSYIMQLMPINFAKELVNQLLNGSDEEAATIEKAVVENMSNQTKSTHIHSHENRVEDESSQAFYSKKEPQFIGDPINKKDVHVEHADFSNFKPNTLNQNEQRNLDMLLDIPLKVTVELGRTNRTIKDILELSAGSIVELDKLAGEPVDILVNQKLIAKGEVVVIDENFGVRLTDIISQSDRLMQLK
ncbi:flagellar motor switch phosphatase FliY [Virgibacillus sp. MSJ-26]|uniref:flagellar motor switch phosphatase FliY n=1 Tax=Virgibacillus sp. MSJ-26 TaxID=2841522 RepID=UPI001C11D7D1|nr:flagellar motor switch phosphatase FliY [Virgibacillus sp. MSJ-26]MBU5466768.1 flagellar motor switch phosphatase FliY [Virgibacillus sp. MSJ-26]